MLSIPAAILLTGVLVAASAALLGTFLVLRGAAMATDAIAHAVVFGIVIVWLATGHVSGPLQILGAAAAGLLAVLLADLLTRSRLVRMDAALGLVFPALFAAGVVLISLYGRNVHLHAETVLLGEIGLVWLDTVEIAGAQWPVAVVVLAAVGAVNAAFVIGFWKELKLASFDPGLAAAMGFAPGVLGVVLLALTSATAVASFQAVGAILFIAFVVVPPATALLLVRRLAPAVLLAMAFGVASAGAGYALAVAWDVSIGGMMALMTGVFFALALVFAPRDGLLVAAYRRRFQRAEADCRALVGHLFSHMGGERAAEENRFAALTGHLRWSERRARAAVLRGLDRGLVLREGARLRLTPKGAAMGRQMLADLGPRAHGVAVLPGAGGAEVAPGDTGPPDAGPPDRSGPVA